MGTGSAWQTHSKGGSDDKATKEGKERYVGDGFETRAYPHRQGDGGDGVVRGDGLAAARPRHIAGVHDTLGVEKLPGIGIKGQMTTRLLTVHHDAEVMGGCKPLLAPRKHHCATVPLPSRTT